MDLKGLHILLTYTCNYECDHCFVWGSPRQSGTFTLARLDVVLRQAKEVGGIREIYFEGGEAFLYYPILVEAVSRAKQQGFWTGIVSNGYWATSTEDAWTWLKPLVTAGLDFLDVSCDSFHGQDEVTPDTHPALIAAAELSLETSTISIDPPVAVRDPNESEPGMPVTGGGVMFRGRAIEKLLTDGLPRQPWTVFNSCPYEDLANAGRVHLDPFGNLHICQGIVIGNLFERSLKRILQEYKPRNHAIAGPLLAGGPAQLVTQYALEHEAEYVDACHICYQARNRLRSRFPGELTPDQMYGLAT